MEWNRPWFIGFDILEGATKSLVETDGLRVFVDEGGIHAVIRTQWISESNRYGKDPEFDFELTSPKRSGSVRLCWYGYSFRLYVDGALEDEEWPLGDPLMKGTAFKTGSGVTSLTWGVEEDHPNDTDTSYDAPFQDFVLPGHNTGIGDCMPFNREDRYCLYYLLDRRGHRSKKGLGAHQWAQVSSADLKHWTLHPMAVGITEQWEGSICTGSLIQKDGKTWAFYAARMSDGSPARLTWATSEDGVHFEKSGEYFALTDPYEPVSARDPKVFLGSDGQYHMLVTTSLVREGRYGGCLAHLTSDDLLHWTQHEPFIVPGYSDQPECSDYFEWNGWYYLVFSNCAVAHYRMSRNPFGPWIRPENDMLDALEVQVPKTACFGDRRLSSGFLARRPRTYAGNAVTHELFQHEDGTLGIKQPEEILPDAAAVYANAETKIDGGNGRAVFGLPAVGGDLRLRARLKIGSGHPLAGLILTRSTDDASVEYRAELDPSAKTFQIIRPDEDFSYGSGRDLLKNIDITDGEIGIDVLLRDDILDIIFSNGRGITMRLGEHAKENRLAFYTIAGKLTVSDLTLEQLK